MSTLRVARAAAGRLVGLLLGLALMPSSLVAQERTITLPVRLENAYLQQALVAQAFKDAGPSARVWDDDSGCNFMVLSDPRVTKAQSTAENSIRVTAAADARIGRRVGDRCVVVLDWSGVINTTQQASLEPGGTVLGFRVVDSAIEDEEVRHGLRVGTLWDWIKQYAHPRLASVRIDLAPALNDLKSVLQLALPLERDALSSTVESITIESVEVVDGGVVAYLGIRVPEDYDQAGAPEPALSAAEIGRFESVWQGWDSFVTFVVKHFAADTTAPEVRRELLEILIQARYDLVDVLAAETRGPDPVRALFVETWSRLAPVLRRLSPELPGERAFNLLSFIAAADALQTLDALGPQFNLDISVAGLRRLVRILVPDAEVDPLIYDQQVDPELRKLFDFGPPLRLKNEQLPPSQGWWQELVPAARAELPLAEAELTRLNSWIPGPGEVGSYLELVHQLLDATSRDVAAASELSPDLHELYRVLVLATAWQETCWRQYRRVADQIVPMRSSAGAVGLMQVVPTVWRGFYESGGLTGDIAYNAVAGSEILMHYLVHYAIARGEHQQPGGRDNLAWATYAAYNGGPRHLHRYRADDTRKSLRSIDQAFRDKFRTIREGDELAVRTCYTD